MRLTDTQKDGIAAQLAAMTGETDEARSLQTGSTPITPAALAELMSPPTRSGVQINESSAKTFTAVFSAIKVISESIAMLPVGLYSGDEDSGVRVRMTRDPVDDLLFREPNPEMSPVVFKEAVQSWAAAWGNGYARIEFNVAGDPVALRPLASDRTHPERRAGQLVYKVDNGDTFAPEEIIHIRSWSGSGLEGLSPIGHNREAIALGKAAELFNAGLFGTGASLGGVIEFPGVLSPEAIAKLKGSFQDKYAGVNNAHRTAVLEEGAKYNRTPLPPEDAMFLNLRKFQVVEVARIFRVPPHMLGDLERSTNNNIEQQALEFLQYCIAPWVLKWEEELTRKLCKPGTGLHVRFDTKALLRTDITARVAFYNAGVQWGWMSRNEVRREEGLPPTAGGDSFLVPANMNIVSATGTVDPSPPPAVPPPAAPPPGGRQGAAMREVFTDVFARMLRKEANATGRGKADDGFYLQHTQHVRDSLRPAARSLVNLMGAAQGDGSDERMEAAITAMASLRQQKPDSSIADIAAARADEMIRRLTASPKEQQ